MSYSPKSLKVGFFYMGTTIGVMKGDVRSSD